MPKANVQARMPEANASRGQLALRGSDGRGLQATRVTGVARANSFARVLRTRVFDDFWKN